MDDLSIIIPALNESRNIRRCVRSCQTHLPWAELVVVDGGSTDNTSLIARKSGARLVRSPRGRGIQCNTGANAANGSLLMFLHADSVISSDAGAGLRDIYRQPDFKIGTLRLSFDRPSPLLSMYAAFTRFDSVWTSFGDQGIVVWREFFEEVGRFPEWPLFEDVSLLQKARRRTTIRSIRAKLTTSSRRFDTLGTFRTQLLNGRLLLRYLCGVSPRKLARAYHCAVESKRDDRTSNGARIPIHDKAISGVEHKA